MKNKPFRMICLGLAAAFILGISGCSPAGSNPGGSNGPGAADGNKKDTVVIASKSEPPTLDTMNQN